MEPQWELLRFCFMIELDFIPVVDKLVYCSIYGWAFCFSDRYKSKPGDDYEDPKDVQAIKEAQLYMGDFNLKTAPDYKIPEHMRINAAKKEEELGHLDSMVLTQSFHGDGRQPGLFFFFFN